MRVTYNKIPLEALIWVAALIGLYFIIPGEEHASLCPLSNLGFDFCPGCGLGRSIHYLLHGNFEKSFSYHPLGSFALIMLSFRVFQLLYRYNYKNNHGTRT